MKYARAEAQAQVNHLQRLDSRAEGLTEALERAEKAQQEQAAAYAAFDAVYAAAEAADIAEARSLRRWIGFEGWVETSTDHWDLVRVQEVAAGEGLFGYVYKQVLGSLSVDRSKEQWVMDTNVNTFVPYYNLSLLEAQEMVQEDLAKEEAALEAEWAA